MRSKKFRSTLMTFGIVIAAFIACQVMISTGAMTRSLKGQLVPICASVVMPRQPPSSALFRAG